MGSVHATIEKCLSKCLVINGSEWNLKSSIGTRDRAYEEELVHWCHGAPGWIPLFCHQLIRNRSFKIQISWYACTCTPNLLARSLILK